MINNNNNISNQEMPYLADIKKMQILYNKLENDLLRQNNGIKENVWASSIF